MIAYLQQINSNLPDMPFPMVSWELTKINNEFLPNIDYIDTNALQGPAYIVPTYRSKNHIVSNNLLYFKKDFFLLPRNFFDRNCWVEMTATQPLTSDELDPCTVLGDQITK